MQQTKLLKMNGKECNNSFLNLYNPHSIMTLMVSWW